MSSKHFRDFLPIESRKRLVYLSLSMAVLFCLLLAQFYRVQIIEGEKWLKKARAQHQLTLIEPCKRGTFYSNTEIKGGHPGSPLAFVLDIPRFHLYADVTAFNDSQKQAIIQKIGVSLSLKEGEKGRLCTHFSTKSKGRKLIAWLTQEERKEIEAWWFPLAKTEKLPRNTLFFVQEFKRSYPYGKMLGQLLHAVREERHPKTHDHIPTGGLELSLDKYLKGKEGKRALLRSPRNALDIGTVVAAPENGADVFLTINHYLQAVAEEEIEKAVVKANAKSGWAIMMDPYTGQILAWAQYPWFDPTRYQDFFNTPTLREESKCKGITDPFEPGSTFKPITMFVCLKANEELKKRGKPPLFSPQEKVATSNGYFPGRTTPIRDTKLHHYLNMYMALQKSSNIYMARMVQRVIDQLGADWYRDCLTSTFGFGTKTGIELCSESAGLLPMPGKMHENGTLAWSKATPYSIAFGHNILVNSLQMVRAYAILANGGIQVQPSLIKKIVKKDKEGKEDVLVQSNEALNKTPVMSKEMLAEIKKGLMYVTKSGGGATKADIFGYTEAGKTATSEKIVNGKYSKTCHISSFIGWSPVETPKFVLMIVIDEPESKFIPGIGKNQYGGNCAAPAFCAIGKKTLEYLGVTPDDPYGMPLGDPRRDQAKAIWAKEAQELAELYHQWNH